MDYSDSFQLSIDSIDVDVSLASLRYHKKMYQPGMILAKLQMSLPSSDTSGILPGMKAVVDTFKGKESTLEVVIDNVTTTVASGYYVFKVVPEYTRSTNGQSVYVTLYVYSPDYKLTLDRFCRSYANKKLATDILLGGLSDTGNPLNKAGFTTDTVDTGHMKFLNYLFSNADNTLVYKEFIQPYLVQYNESFFDFMCRTANRCGEFFYYEDGKLHLGVDDFSAAPAEHDYVDIDRDTVLSYRCQQADETLVSVTDYYYNSLEKKTDNGNAYSYNDELPLNEYLGNMVEKDSFTSTLNEFFPKALKSIPEMMAALSTGGIAGLVGWVASTVIMGTVFASSSASKKNKIFNSTWVDDSEPEKNKGNYTERYDSNDKKATLYGSLLTKDVQQKNYVYNQNINNALYEFIGKGSKTVTGGLIEVNIGTEQTPFLLGQSVTFESKSDISEKKTKMGKDDVFNFDRYIIVEVSEVFKSEATDANKEEWQPGQRVVLAPLYSVSTTKYNATAEEAFKIACPPVMCQLVKTSGAQRAFVSEGVDPLGYGRVRIKYPWQSSSDDESPFIRMAVPYVPNTGENGGGFYFQPREGTEVLVDYEHGNIERPYVIGSLYNAQSKAPRDGATYSTWPVSLHEDLPSEPLTISSLKGHKIKLDDNGNTEDFLMSALPALDLLKPIWKPIFSKVRLDQEGNSCFTGGITLTDKWGLYKIECSTTNRSVTVNSPFGNVKINAFTGISINAPNGDVSIKGKNVTIEAGNELKLRSGLNIDKPGYSVVRDTILKGITGAVTDIALQLVDMRLLRDVLEIFLKPVAGTMTLKSNRYLLLGAGLGMPEIPSKAYSVKGAKQLETENDCLRLVKQLVWINTQVDQFSNDYVNEYTEIREAVRMFGNYVKPDAKEKNLKKLTDSSKEGFFYQADFDFPDNIDDDEVMTAMFLANQVYRNIRAMRASCKRIFEECEGFILTKSYPGQLFTDNYSKIAKKIIPKCEPEFVRQILTGEEKFTKTDADLEEDRQTMKDVKRMIAYGFVNEGYAVEYVGEPLIFNEMDDICWMKWVNNLHRWTGKSVGGAGGAAVRFLKEVKDEAVAKAKSMSGYNAIHEKGIWGTGQKGEVLICDKDGSNTISFQNGAISRAENSDGYVTKVKAMLSLM